MRASSPRELIDKRVWQSEAQNAGKLRSDRVKALQRNAKLAIIERAGPGWRLGHVEECLIGVEHNLDARLGLTAEVRGQVGISRFQGGHDLATKCFRALMTFVAEYKVSGFMLAVVGLGL